MNISIQAAPFVLADSPADLEVLNFLFLAYLGRRPTPSDIAGMLTEREMKIDQIEATLRDSSEYRNRGYLLHHNFGARPDGSILMIEPARIFFYPIAKVANSSVKDWALRLVGEELPNGADIHRYLDSGSSKIQIRHWPKASISARMQDPSWARVAILRDPEDRLVSCYWDKFVSNRTHPATLFHTMPVYRFFHGEHPTEEQIARGLSFRQLCHYINHSPRDQMDTHWMAQHRCLENFRWDRLFAIDRIADFESFVLNRCPSELKDVRLGRENVAARRPERIEKDISNRVASEFAGMRKPPNHCFLPPDIRAFIADYYALDGFLISQARAQRAP